MLHFRILLTVNAPRMLMHSKYYVHYLAQRNAVWGTLIKAHIGFDLGFFGRSCCIMRQHLLRMDAVYDTFSPRCQMLLSPVLLGKAERGSQHINIGPNALLLE